jgi:hypothetical protein
LTELDSTISAATPIIQENVMASTVFGAIFQRQGRRIWREEYPAFYAGCSLAGD